MFKSVKDTEVIQEPCFEILMSKELKHYIKFLISCKDKNILEFILKNAPNSVIKAISNAALNALRGEVHLTSHQKKQFAKHRALFKGLSKKSVSLKNKRQIIQRGNGFGIIPTLLAVVLSSLGPLFLNKK